MNEEPGGTPNPLNPGPGAAPIRSTDYKAAPLPEPLPKEQTPEPIHLSEQETFEPTAGEPAQVEPTMDEPTKFEPVTQSAPAEYTEASVQDDEIKPVKKSNKKLAMIIGGILIGIAVICGVVAILMLTVFKSGDAVSLAMNKLMSGKAPENVALSGTISLSQDSGQIGVSAVPNTTISLNSEFNRASGNHKVSATVTATLFNDQELSFGVDELHIKDSDVFVKISGVTNIINTLSALGMVSDSNTANDTNCIGDDSGMTNCMPATDCTSEYDCIEATNPILTLLTSVFGVIDDEWIKISSEYFNYSTVSDMFEDSAGDFQCLIGVANNLPNYDTNFGTLYEKNQFIEYSTENLKIAKKKGSLYRLSFNAEKLTDFLNSLSNVGITNEVLACMGETATNTKAELGKIKDAVAKIPEIYVEINDENDFTRVYFNFDSEDETSSNSSTITADLSFSYPSTIEISEPSQYIDINTLIMSAMMNLDLPISEVQDNLLDDLDFDFDI